MESGIISFVKSVSRSAGKRDVQSSGVRATRSKVALSLWWLCIAASAPIDPLPKWCDGDYFVDDRAVANTEVTPEFGVHQQTASAWEKDKTSFIANALAPLHEKRGEQ